MVSGGALVHTGSSFFVTQGGLSNGRRVTLSVPVIQYLN